MDNKLSIKINIADRFYPLNIERSDEEKIRKSAQMINDKISQYKYKYSNKDTFDFMAMTALQFAVKYIEIDSEINYKVLKEEVKQINKDLEKYINSTLKI